MESKYEYLKKYIPGGGGVNDNWFCNISKDEIIAAEKIIKLRFPIELRSFYEEIGYGMLRSPHTFPKDYELYDNNEILHPMAAAHFYQGIIEHQKKPKEEALHYEDNWLALSSLEDFVPGDLPFFEIGDSSSFMIMKLNSDNPNAVWFMGHEKIEDSFEEFIRKLYYEGPSYYAKNW